MNESVLQKVEREIAIMKLIEHPHILQRGFNTRHFAVIVLIDARFSVRCVREQEVPLLASGACVGR